MIVIKYIIGGVLIAAGVALGLYVGLWWFFVGGIISIIDGVKADPTDAGMIAWGIVRVVLAQLAGFLTFVACTGLATIFFVSAEDSADKKALTQRKSNSTHRVGGRW